MSGLGLRRVREKALTSHQSDKMGGGFVEDGVSFVWNTFRQFLLRVAAILHHAVIVGRIVWRLRAKARRCRMV